MHGGLQFVSLLLLGSSPLSNISTLCTSNLLCDFLLCFRFERFARGEHHIAPEEQVSHDWDFEGFNDFEELGEEEEDLSISTESRHSDHHVRHRH